MLLPNLLQQYNQLIPRYTSYPTVPQWQDWTSAAIWEHQLETLAIETVHDEGVALYIHLPFCEHLCTYCGCNKKITTNHRVEEPYIDRVIKEWLLYVKAFRKKRLVIRELHLGGGTPTFFSPEQLAKLLEGIFEHAYAHSELEMSFEGHPNNTTQDHLQTLFSLGFRRVSFGVQDLDPEVQRLINRIQPLENLLRVTEQARKTGYSSINYDLIYGLPLQNIEKLDRTLREVIGLKPDRVAFYGYAHVPWKSRAQRLYDESHLPTPAERMELYAHGRNKFLEAGYQDIGMDHFALPNDGLLQALRNKTLHRNFMGYTTNPTKMLIGLGVSAISDLGSAFGQNSKELVQWERQVDAGIFPINKGLVLTNEDALRQKLILEMSCQGEVALPTGWTFEPHQHALMLQMQHDELLEVEPGRLKLTKAGQLFTRHACSLFDAYLSNQQKQNDKQFSQAV